MSSHSHAGALGTPKALQKQRSAETPKRVIRISYQLRRTAMLMSVMFLLLSGISVYMRNIIINLDTDIRVLESDLNEAKKINDALQTEIMQGHDQNIIHTYASEKLGMVLPAQKNIEYYAYSGGDEKGSSVYSVFNKAIAGSISAGE